MKVVRNILLLVIGLPALGFFGLQFYIKHKITQGIDNSLEQNAALSTAVSYDNVLVSILDKTVGIEGIRFVGEESEQDVYIEKLGVTDLKLSDFFVLGDVLANIKNNQNQMPNKLTGFVHGMNVSVDNAMFSPEAQDETYYLSEFLDRLDINTQSLSLTREQYKDLGINEFTINYDLGYNYNPDRQVLSVHLDVAEDQLYRVKAKIVTDFDPDNTEEIRETLRELIISSVTIEYEDFGYVGYLYETAAAQQKLPVEILKLNVKIALDELIVLKWNWNELGDESLSAIHDFMQQPNTISLSIDPSRSFKLKDLPFYKTAEMPGLLNLSMRN